jgi:hypothetical protein
VVIQVGGAGDSRVAYVVLPVVVLLAVMLVELEQLSLAAVIFVKEVFLHELTVPHAELVLTCKK